MLNYHFKQLEAYKILVFEHNQMVAKEGYRKIAFPKKMLKAIKGTVVENCDLNAPVDCEELLDVFESFLAIQTVHCNVQETLEQIETSKRKLDDSYARGLKVFKSLADIYDFIFGWYITTGETVWQKAHSDPDFFQALD